MKDKEKKLTVVLGVVAHDLVILVHQNAPEGNRDSNQTQHI